MAVKSESEPLRPGVAGVEQTVGKMTRLIREAATNEFFVDWVQGVVSGARSHDTAAVWRAIWGYLTGLHAPAYRYDPVDVELVRSPFAFIHARGGDCDDFATLAGAMLEALGYPVKVEVVGKTAPKPGRGPRFSHVFIRVQDPATRRWFAFDPVLDRPGRFRATPGMEVRAAVRKDFSMLQPSYDSQQLGNWLDDIGKQLDISNSKNPLRGLVSAIPGVGTLAITAADQVAAVNKATGGGLTKIVNGLRQVKATSHLTPVRVSSRAAPATRPAPTVSLVSRPAPMPTVAAPTPEEFFAPRKRRWSTGAKVGVAAAGVAAAGGIVFAMTRKKKS